MSAIHQIYCTHCTHGSSALERREGELAHRMLGYSARAGSLEPRELRQYYRQIERYAHYYLPRDTPTEEKLRLTASTAPRRLVYYPAAGGLQVIAQVCYRQTDTEGRPGSYFAHVLFRRQDDGRPPWSPLDCLGLWRASGWVEEDSSHIPYFLAPLDSLAQLLDGRRPAIDDAVFLSFLTTPAGGSFDDPARVIPERWRGIDAARRCSLFTEAFRGFLEVSPARRESLLLVIEPGAAAIVFYGMLRLLPAGAVRDSVSFSTFEPSAERGGATLAATSFHDPRKTDLRPEAYRSRGFALNTFSERRSDYRAREAHYAESMVHRLVSQGWEAVDWSLRSLQSAGAAGPDDLNALAAVDKLVPALFDPHGPAPPDDWRRRPMAAAYLRQAVGRWIAAQADPGSSLEPIVGRPAHLTLLELIATEPQVPGTQAAARFLLDRFPGERMGELLKLEGVSPESKVEVLVRHVTAHTNLPPGCDFLWSQPPRPGGAQTTATAPLLWQVLARLDANVLVAFYNQAAPKHSGPFLLGMLGACRLQPSARFGLGQVVRCVGDDALLALFQRQGAAFFREYPDDDPALGERLHAIVASLPQHLAQFPERLDVVLAGRHLLPDDDQDVVTAWVGLRRSVQEVCRLQAEKSGILRKRPLDELENACRRMAEEITRAMPDYGLHADPTGDMRLNCLRQIGRRLSGAAPFLPDAVWQHEALWQKIAWHFQDGKWSPASLSKMRDGTRSLNARWILIGALAAVPLVLLIAAALRSFDRPGTDIGHIAETSQPVEPATTRTPPPPPEAQPSRREAPPNAERLPTTETNREAAQPAEPQPDDPTEPPPPDDDPFKPPNAASRPAEKDQNPLQADEPPTESPRPQEPPPPVEPPMPEVAEPEAESWQDRAERFAREHAGKLFRQARLTQAQLRIPADALPPARQGTGLFLGAGRLHFDHAVYPFGDDFYETAPVSRHEVPELARFLAVPSVYVELQAGPSGSAVVLKLLPNVVSPEQEAKKEELIDQIESTARLLMVNMRAYNARGAGKEEQDEAFENLVRLTGIEIPPVPRKPNRRDEEFLDDPDAYSAALEAYNEAVTVHNRAQAAVIPTAKRAVASKDERKSFVQNEFRRYEEQLEQHNKKASAALEQCRAISVIVYQAAADTEPDDASATPESSAAEDEAPPESKTANSIDGRFVVEEKPAGRLDPPAIARLRPIVTATGGRPLPPWYDEEIVTGCRIMEQDAGGLLLRTITLRDVYVEREADLFEKTAAIHVQFRFYRRSKSPVAGEIPAALALAAHEVKAIEEGRLYTVKLELSKEAVSWLRLLAKD